MKEELKKEEKPLLIFHKKADASNSRIIIPKFFVQKHGLSFFMEIYEDRIVLIPNKEGK